MQSKVVYAWQMVLWLFVLNVHQVFQDQQQICITYMLELKDNSEQDKFGFSIDLKYLNV